MVENRFSPRPAVEYITLRISLSYSSKINNFGHFATIHIQIVPSAMLC